MSSVVVVFIARLSSPPRLDAAVVFGLGVVVLVHSQLLAGPGDLSLLPFGLVLVGVAAAALAWRRRAPLPVLLITTAAVVVYYVVGLPRGPAVVLVAVALYSVAVSRRWWWAVGTGLALIAVVLVAGRVAAAGGLRPTDVVWMTATVVAIGVAIGATRRARAAMIARVEDVARLRIERERLRVAQEVHDVVTHSLAMINVQAGVGAHVADRRPEQAKDALLTIKEASRVALADLRATLAVLRGPADHPSTDRVPAPSLARMGELVRAAESAGLTITVRGEPGELPAPVDAAAFRILQEAMTNVVRHATGARQVSIDIDRRGEVLRLRVRDDGRAPAAPVAGVGLRGMVERAAALGGRAQARPSSGGFVVDAELPLASVSAR